MEKIKNSSFLTVGSKQTTKAVKEGAVQLVFLAKDAEAQVTAPLKELCSEHGVEIIYVDSMKELGEACGIQVGSASAGVALEELRGKEVE